MNYLYKILVVVTLMLCSVQLYAQEPQTTPAEESGAEVGSPFDENAPMLKSGTTPKLYHIRRVNVRGVKYLNTDILKASVGLIEGDSVYLPSSFISDAITRLWSQSMFSDVKIGAEIDGDSLDLEVFLKERPRVNNWAFAGVSKSKQTDMMEQLKLRRGIALSDYVISKNEYLIKQYWADKGFRNVEVTTRIEEDTVRKQMVNVTFDIDRKEKVKIGVIDFKGNNVFPDKRLRRTFKKTHQKSINFFQSKKLDEKEFLNDKELLIDFYNSKGYRNANILRDSIYKIDDKHIGIDIELSEGNQYFIRNVTWVGNSLYATEDLQRIFGLKTGDVYDKKSMQKRLGIGKETNPEDASAISSLYQNRGYLMSQIEPVETIVGPDSIDIEVKIFEGKQFRINEVGITGNERVDDEAIRRELYTRPGELYDRSMLMQTIRMLGSMGHFNPETIMPDIKPVSSELVNVNWPLEEQASDQFNIAGGFGEGTFVGSVGITLNNLSVRNFFKKGSWRPYPMGQNQKLAIAAQTNGTYYKAVSLSFTDPWLGGKKPNSFSIGGHFSEQNDAYYVWQTATQYFRTYGATAGLGKRLVWPDPYFTFYGELSYERFKLKNWNTFGMTNGAANLLSLKLVFARSSVDQPVYPRRGSEFSLSVEATPPYSLWDGKNYRELEELSKNSATADQANQERYRWVEFHKWQLKAQWFQALSKNSNLVLMLKAEMGYLGAYNKYKVSPFERFDVGGDGMSGYNIYGIDIISMRGYEDGALNPTSDYARAYNKYTLELRYPVILKPSSQIYVLGFLEGGNAFQSWQKFSPFKIKRSAGLGVRLSLPVVGLIGVDWGYGFDAPAGLTKRSGSQFHFVMGQQF